MFLINVGILISIIVLVILVVVGILLIFILKKKNKKIKVNDKFIEDVIINLGNKENIKQITVDNARLKILLNDISIADFDKLKEMSGQGVFITGNNVKLLFKFDSKLIKKEIEKRL